MKHDEVFKADRSKRMNANSLVGFCLIIGPHLQKMFINIDPILAAVHLKTKILPQNRFILLTKKRHSTVDELN